LLDSLNNIYVFGAGGQDGKLLVLKLRTVVEYANLVLFTRNTIRVEGSQPKYHEITSHREYLGIVDEIFKIHPPSIIYYLAATHYSHSDVVSNKYLDGDFANKCLPLHIFDFLIRYNLSKCYFMFTSSSLVFNGSGVSPQNESTPRSPICDYAKSKCIVEENLTLNIENGSFLGSTAIMYNHESKYRGNRFFTAKAISSIQSVSSNRALLSGSFKISFFNPLSYIDMGYASEYVDAIMLLASSNCIGTYIVSSGTQIMVKEFIDIVLAFFSVTADIIEYKDVPQRSKIQLYGDNTKIRRELSWSPKIIGAKLARRLCYDYATSRERIHTSTQNMC